MATINWSLLQSWSPERAWWFGVFLGDGCAPARGASVQCTGSISTITRWRKLITPDEIRLFEHVRTSPGSFQCSVGSRALSDWMLSVHGYRGKKSDKLTWPEDLPQEFKVHFIRGLWDSDGCIYVQDQSGRKTRGNPRRSLIYTSIAVPFVERLAKEIEGALGVVAPKLRLQTIPQTGNVRAQLAYAGADAQRLADWLYAEAPEHIRNEDRAETYAQMVALRESLHKPCVCGDPEVFTEGECRACWQAHRPRKVGPGTVCSTEGCGGEVWANGLCAKCRSRKRRADDPNHRKSTGTCQCEAPAYRKGFCDADYERNRRGVALLPAGSRAGLAVPATS